MKEIYLDNNATTKLDPRVAEVVCKEILENPSNPSSAHFLGRKAKARLSEARETVARYLKKPPQEIFFTSGGTEAINTLILGAKGQGTILTTKIEHSAVNEAIKKTGRPVKYIPIDERGHVDPEIFHENLTPDVELVVLSAANSETGVKTPLEQLTCSVPLIVDGVALMGKEPFTIPDHVQAMAFSGHKFHAPKGVGFFWASKKLALSPLLLGGGQEKGLRSGTENLPGIMGLAEAVEMLDEVLPSSVESLRDYLETTLLKTFPALKINGTGPRIPNTTNIAFPEIDGEIFLAKLDEAKLAVSMGSACSSGAIEPSRVLLHMGVDPRLARSSIRFSLSRMTTKEEIDEALFRLSQILQDLQLRV